MTRAIMLQGTGSNVGKSLIAAGLCRAFANRGLKVAPFKPQNMSNNAAVTVDGGEIGRAQALQARAARREPGVHMNPVLLKPEATGGAQVIVQGQRARQRSRPATILAIATAFCPRCCESFQRLAGDADLVIVEGAGSPAEINLRDGDIANMGFAEAANIPVILIGDIHRGGVIASIVGTFVVLDPADAALIKRLLINNFHGDPTLFDAGRQFLEERTGVPCLGVVPHFAAMPAGCLPRTAWRSKQRPATNHGPIRIAVLRLPRIANFDDLDPLRLEPASRVEFVQPGAAVPAHADVVIIPGSKSTIADLRFLREQGWDIDIRRPSAARRPRCSAFAAAIRCWAGAFMIRQGLEGQPESVDGLGLLDVETTLEPEKALARVSAIHVATDTDINGYEIHLGRTSGADCARPFAMVGAVPDGAISRDGRVAGTYHPWLLRERCLPQCLPQPRSAARPDRLGYAEHVERTLDALAEHLTANLDIERVFAIAAPVERGLMLSTTLSIAFAALVIERLAGYPKFIHDAIGHPVEWIGAVIGGFEEALNHPDGNRIWQKFKGAFALFLTLVLVAILTIPFSLWLRHQEWGWLLEAVLATTLLAQFDLYRHVRAVYAGLEKSLDDGRRAVSRIVGRDPDQLDESGVTRAAIESLAENASDARDRAGPVPGVVRPARHRRLQGHQHRRQHDRPQIAPLHRFRLGFGTPRRPREPDTGPAERAALRRGREPHQPRRRRRCPGPHVVRCPQARVAQCRLARGGDGRRARHPPRRAAQL